LPGGWGRQAGAFGQKLGSDSDTPWPAFARSVSSPVNPAPRFMLLCAAHLSRTLLARSRPLASWAVHRVHKSPRHCPLPRPHRPLGLLRPAGRPPWARTIPPWSRAATATATCSGPREGPCFAAAARSGRLACRSYLPLRDGALLVPTEANETFAKDCFGECQPAPNQPRPCPLSTSDAHVQCL
jgi:hypothetical protein